MTDTLTTEVVGYRAWNLDPVGYLHSIGVNHVWRPGLNTATCLMGYGPGCGYVPSPIGSGCGACGLYGFHRASSIAHADGAGWGRPNIGGLICAHGHLEIHPDGFRAEHAKVVALVARQGGHELTLALARAAQMYGVNLVHPAEIEAVASEFGIAVPDELKPGGHRVADVQFINSSARIIQGWSIGTATPPDAPPSTST